MSSFELSEREERFAEWEATPRAHRNPPLLKDLAAELGVDVSQLHRWRRRPNVRERMMELVDDAVGGPDRVAEVLEAVRGRALGGSTRDAELFLRYAGVLVERKEVKHFEGDEIAQLTDEQIREELAELR